MSQKYKTSSVIPNIIQKKTAPYYLWNCFYFLY